MHITKILAEEIRKIALQLFGNEIDASTLVFNHTPKDFEGDYTLVVFPLVKVSKKDPTTTANMLGEALQLHTTIVAEYNVVKGFLNLKIKDSFWLQYLTENYNSVLDARLPHSPKILIEYSSPNTNKPIHLGHVRNNVLGIALRGLLSSAGYDVKTCNLINDRGIHICKSMYAWQQLGKGETPSSSGIKGDHLVGKYYVEFDRILQSQRKPLLDKVLAGDMSFLTPKHLDMAQKLLEKYALHQDDESLSALKKIIDNYTTALQEAQQLLRLWEVGDEDTLRLWSTMNAWVYEGFEVTYNRMGVSFDKTYYESDTYLLGKTLVQDGVKAGFFYTKDDGSIWVDLSDQGLDHKLLLRADGTSVYITQDMGTAELKFLDFEMDKSVYVVGNEQDYHFKILQLILKKMRKPYADGIYHFSYGMVDLPSGRMKSREGTVVDADDLMDEMIAEARHQTESLGKTSGFTPEELENLYTIIGLGALKFYLLRVDPKKRILFDPKESIDLHGYTGPFVQYAYARIQSILRRATQDSIDIHIPADYSLQPCEKEVIFKIYQYSTVLQEAAAEYNPSKIIDYAYELAKIYNKFYAEVSIFQAQQSEKSVRIALSQATGNLLKTCFNMMGIEVPERM